jgi:hypothetical protein
MVEGVCLKCGVTVDGADIDRTFFPVNHTGCGGDVAVHIDIGAAIRERLFPSPKPPLGPSPEFFVEALGKRLAMVEEIQVINTLYGGPFDNEGVECECGERTKKDPCVHCGRPVEIEYAKSKRPTYDQGPSYVSTSADRPWERDDDG